MDLGVHLVDALHWTIDSPVVDAHAHFFAKGRRLEPSTTHVVEDFAAAELTLESGALARLACSWRLSAGVDARIEMAFYGTRGAAVFRNVNGSFYDFVAEHCVGTRITPLCGPPDDWGGRAIVAWVKDLLSREATFDPAIERTVVVAETLDRLYGRTSTRQPFLADWR